MSHCSLPPSLASSRLRARLDGVDGPLEAAGQVVGVHLRRRGLYLAPVIDVFSRRVVGWAMAEHLRTEFIFDALDMALARRRPSQGLVHHSDGGTQ